MGEFKVFGDGDVVCGKRSSFGEGVKFIFKSPRKIVIGDYVTFGDNVKIVVEDGDVFVDDWTTVHSNVLILCAAGVSIGQHCWFGQNTILDGTGGLTIGNGVRVGMYSQIWSHIAAGEQIEGCVFFSASPVFIEDDVWLVGSCTVGSGLTIGRRAVCLSGSNVTRSIPENVTVAGAPAKIREAIKAYKTKTLDEKFSMMRVWALAFCNESGGRWFLSVSDESVLVICSVDMERVKIFKSADDYASCDLPVGDSKFCVESKSYSKSFTEGEEELMRYLSGNKARFLRTTANVVVVN
ncbi:acyltransferase [Pseudomonas gingeri]